MPCDDLSRVFDSALRLRCIEKADGLYELTLPVRGLDGYLARLWASRRVDGWHLTDDGELVDALWGVDEQAIADRVAAIAGDLPVWVRGGALQVELVDLDDPAAALTFRAAVQAIASAWSLRLEQAVPSTELSTKKRISLALDKRRIAYAENVDLLGASGLRRRFDLSVGGADAKLVRASDTDSPSYFQRAAELYTVAAADLRRASGQYQFSFYFAWNDSRLEGPDNRVLTELAGAGINYYPASELQQMMDSLAA